MVGRARAHLPVVVVDDGSTDDTAAQAEAAGAAVLRQVPNAGKGAALRAGFRYALEQGAPAVVTLDADGQHDPDEIPAFLAAFEATASELAGRRRPELVIGCRDFSDMPPLRRLSNTLGTWIFSAAVGRHIADNQSGYRLIGPRLMTALLDSDESGFEFEVEMIARCIALGLPMVDVADPHHLRRRAQPHSEHGARAAVPARELEGRSHRARRLRSAAGPRPLVAITLECCSV